MSRLHYQVVLAACLTALAGTSFGQANAVKFTSSGILMAGPTVEAGLAACQPLRGDLAEISGPAQQAYGTDVLPLRVVSGRCAGTAGWAGASRVEVASAAAVASPEAAQFSSSDSLFDALTPKTVKAACQPLRGDGARIMEASHFAGTEVYRVNVLSGRCQGATGWVGAARIERPAAPPSR
jgi:hypothetical protein